ncbi:MAG: hypothetical protein M5U01_09320 [Ardenticatenaceae bacterium]|nr:hypothetical protein [Ardenticatenaceae bacterium]
MLTSVEKIWAAFDHVEGPVPWLEIAIDEAIMLRSLGKPVPEAQAASSQQIDISWTEKVAFARAAGIDALGIYHWETFGTLRDESQPVLDRVPLIHTRADLARLEIPTFTPEELAPQVRAARAAIGDSGLALYCEFAFCLDYAIADMGFEGLCLSLYDDPGLVEEVLARYAAYTANLIEIYCQMPEIDFIWVGDDLAYKAGPFISPAALRRHVFPFFRDLACRITKPWIFHSDGNILPVIEDILALGPVAIHPIEPGAMDIYAFKREYGQRVALIGNLSVDQLARATPAEITAEVEWLLAACAPGGGYGFSSGNALSRFIRVQNLLAASETLRRYNRRWME